MIHFNVSGGCSGTAFDPLTLQPQDSDGWGSDSEKDSHADKRIGSVTRAFTFSPFVGTKKKLI